MADAFFSKSTQGGDKATDHSVVRVGDIDLAAVVLPVLDCLDIGFIVFDRDCQVQFSTASAGRLILLVDKIDVSLSVGTESKVNWSQILSEVLNQGQIERFHSVRYHCNQQTKRLDITCCPVRDSEGGITGGAVVLKDVTEEAAYENEFIQTERLIALGKIAGKVAHEMNNPMDGILRYLNLAIRVLDQGDSDKAKEFLSQSRSGLLRMVNILSELLEFSRGTHQAMELSPLDKIVEDSLSAMHTHTAGLSVNVVRRYEGAVPKLRNDGLVQVFNNLIKNAADAMQGKGDLTITIERTELGWQIHFQDTGPGVPAEMTEAIFQPFFTTKAPGRGSGLGLAICKDLIEKHRGTISVRSPQGGGSIFTVSIPDTILT